MTSRRLRLIAAAVAVGAFALATALLVDTHGLLAEAQARQDALAACVQAHPWLSPGIFLFCAMLGTLTPFPGGLLVMLTGGFLFGSIGGGLLSAAGVVCSACLVCLAGRRLFASADQTGTRPSPGRGDRGAVERRLPLSAGAPSAAGNARLADQSPAGSVADPAAHSPGGDFAGHPAGLSDRCDHWQRRCHARRRTSGAFRGDDAARAIPGAADRSRDAWRSCRL